MSGIFYVLTRTDAYEKLECGTCGTVFYRTLGGPAVCPHCAGIRGIPARIRAGFARLLARVIEWEASYDL